MQPAQQVRQQRTKEYTGTSRSTTTTKTTTTIVTTITEICGRKHVN
jgi:hypothetical protein